MNDLLKELLKKLSFFSEQNNFLTHDFTKKGRTRMEIYNEIYMCMDSQPV